MFNSKLVNVYQRVDDENDDLPIENHDLPVRYVKSPEGMLNCQLKNSASPNSLQKTYPLVI